MGSAALFFLLRPETARLNDACHPLIATYRAVAHHSREIAIAASSYPVNEDTYYAVRSQRPDDELTRAADFIYLNKVGWNGLYRVNGSGVFNVPYGRPKTTNVVDINNLEQCGRLLAQPGIELCDGDFERALDDVGEGDLVYLDPPYVTTHNNNGFIDYNEELFGWRDQVRLAKAAGRAAAAGATVIVTNADHPDVTALYPQFLSLRIRRHSTLAGDASKRRPVTESMLYFRPEAVGGIE